MRDKGFFSFQTLIMILFISTLAAGVGTGISLTRHFVKRVRRITAEREFLQDEVMAVINQLSGDPTPDTDSAFDPVWDYIRNTSTGNMKLQLTDLSSRININSVHPLFLERTELRNTFKTGSTVETFRDARNQYGFCIEIPEVYRNIFKESALENYFTPYGFMNINTAYEFSLQRMFERLTGDPVKAEVFHSFLAQSLTSKRIIANEALQTAFRSSYRSISPLIGTCPEMNVNFMPEFVLKQVLHYPYGGKQLKNSSATLKIILYLRKIQEINSSQLRSIIHVGESLQERIFQYLGTKTWFWEIVVETTESSARAVAVYLPETTEYRLYSFAVSHLP